MNVAQDSDGDSDRDAAAGAVGQNHPRGLLQGMLQSLDRLGLNAANQINPNADAESAENRPDQEPGLSRQAFKAFTQSLLQALDQFNRSKAKASEAGGEQSSAPATETGYGTESPYGDLPTTLRSLANALDEGTATGQLAVANLQTSFDELASQLATTAGSNHGPASGVTDGIAARGNQPAKLADFLTNLSEALAIQHGTADLQAGKTGMLIDQTV
ncbi:MAG: hypothetical protein FIA97_20200 [Methylococcaceae bacterium]|nr:hypothetical protein [Methylococcaceae bacterium]